MFRRQAVRRNPGHQAERDRPLLLAAGPLEITRKEFQSLADSDSMVGGGAAPCQLSHNTQIGYGAPAQSADHAADAQPTIRGFKEEGF